MIIRMLSQIALDILKWSSRILKIEIAFESRHKGHDGVSKHQPHHCLLNHLFKRTSKETSKLRVTGLCEGNSPVTGEFPAQMASSAENVSIWWRHHGVEICGGYFALTCSKLFDMTYVIANEVRIRLRYALVSHGYFLKY